MLESFNKVAKQIFSCEFCEIFKNTFFLQTTSDRNASENLRDVFVQQIFSLQLKLCLRLIYFHSYSFATSIAKMSSEIFFSNVS